MRSRNGLDALGAGNGDGIGGAILGRFEMRLRELEERPAIGPRGVFKNGQAYSRSVAALQEAVLGRFGIS